MAKTLKARQICAVCGAKTKPTENRVCDACRAAGYGNIPIEGRPDGRHLMRVAIARARWGKPPLEGMTMEEVNAIVRTYYMGSPYNSYGKLRAYVDSTGKLPGVRK